MAIEKWYCLKCDNCGEVINYWERSSIREAIEAEKQLGGSIILSSGRCFCDEKCRRGWMEKVQNDR